MRGLPSSLLDNLSSGASTLCRCWRITRQDGLILSFTDHDQTLQINGEFFETRGGFEVSAMNRAADFTVQGGEIRGIITSDSIKENEIEAGMFDGAIVEAFLVDWQNPSLNSLIEAASIGEIRRMDNRFIAELRDAFAPYDMERGRLYSSFCSACFGDSQCTIDTTKAQFTQDIVITAIQDSRIFLSSNAANQPADFYTFGNITFKAGANKGFSSKIEGHNAEKIILSVAPPSPLNIGDQATLTAGCDKQFSTCRDRFSNAINFRGFPYIPAPESVFTYALPGEGKHKGRPLVR